MASKFGGIAIDEKEQQTPISQFGGVSVAPVEEPGFISRAASGISEAFTGAERSTPEIDALEEIGAAPELNQLSVSAFKTSMGLLATGDEEKARNIIQSQIPEAKFRSDAKGNTIVDLPSGSFALNKPGLSGQDIIRTAGQALSFTPAGRAATIPASIGGRVAAAAGLEGATELGLQAGVEALGGGPIDQGEVLTAAAFGAGGQTLADLLGMSARAIKGNIPTQAQETIQAGAEAGVPVLTTDVIAPKGIIGGLARQVGERIPFVGTGGIRAGQQEARETAAVEFVNQFPRASSLDIMESLKRSADTVKQAAGNRMTAITGRMNQTGPVNIRNINATIDKVIAALDAPGVIPDAATVEKLQSVKLTLNEAEQTFGMLRENRTAIRELTESIDPIIRQQLPSKSKAELEEIMFSMTKTLDNVVRSVEGDRGFKRYKEADRVYMREANKLTKSRLKNVLDKGDITPELVENLLFSKKPSEVKLLFQNLDKRGRDAARSGLVARAVEKASRGDDLSINRLDAEFKRLQKNTGVFFRNENRKALKGFSNLISATRRAQDAKVVTPSGQSLTALTGIGAGSQIGLLPSLALAGSAGGAAQIYESPVVRDFLLKLADAPRGSTRFDRIVNDLSPGVIAAIEAIQRQQGQEEQPQQ